MKPIIYILLLFAFNATAQPIQSNNKKDAIPVLSAEVLQQMVPAQGFVAFNKTTGCLNYFFGENWFEVCGKCFPAVQLPSIDSVLQFNNLVKVFYNLDSNSTLSYKCQPSMQWQAVEDSILVLQIPINASSLTISLRSFNSCGTKDTTLSLPITPLDIGPIDTTIINNRSYVSRKFGSTRWMCQNYPPAQTLLKETPDFVAFTNESSLCPKGWELPKHSDWLLLLQNFSDNNQAVFELPTNDNISIGLTKLGLYSVEEKKYYTQNAAYYWTKGKQDTKQQMLYITNQGIRLLAEDATKALMPLRCIRYE